MHISSSLYIIDRDDKFARDSSVYINNDDDYNNNNKSSSGYFSRRSSNSSCERRLGIENREYIRTVPKKGRDFNFRNCSDRGGN